MLNRTHTRHRLDNKPALFYYFFKVILKQSRSQKHLFVFQGCHVLKGFHISISLWLTVSHCVSQCLMESYSVSQFLTFTVSDGVLQCPTWSHSVSDQGVSQNLTVSKGLNISHIVSQDIRVCHSFLRCLILSQRL